MAINIMEAFNALPEGYEWQFLPDRPTWLQTDSIRDGEARPDTPPPAPLPALSP
jgi:hypothetical protein